MRPLRWLWMMSVVFAVSAPTRALAQQPTLADRETARALMDEGDRQRDGGDLEAALKSYEAADALMGVPTTAIDVARTQVALGKLLEARETLTKLLRIPEKRKEPPPFVAARKAAAELYDELSSRIPAVEIVVKAPPGAELQVTIDGEPVPTETLGMARKVNPGAHVIVVRSGSSEERAEVQVEEGALETVEIEIEGEPSSTADQRSAAEADQTSGGSNTLLTYSGFGLAAAGLITGTVTGIISLSKTGDLKERCPSDLCPPGSQGEIDSALTMGTVSTVAFAAGGVGLAIGVVGLLLPGSEARAAGAGHATKPAASPTYRAVVGPSYVGVRGTF